jgi:hypothetical protein
MSLITTTQVPFSMQYFHFFGGYMNTDQQTFVQEESVCSTVTVYSKCVRFTR